MMRSAAGIQPPSALSDELLAVLSCSARFRHRKEEASAMRIISWNCNMAYATKQEDILALHPDVILLQECSERHIKESGAPFAHWVALPHFM
jgi:hypothetical protein